VRRKKPPSVKALHRRAMWRIIQGMGVDQTDDYDTLLMWIVRCMSDQIRDPAYRLASDARRFATAITEEHAERIVEVAGPYRYWNAAAIGQGIRLTYAVRRAFKAWSIIPVDATRAVCARRRKQRDRERKARLRREAGALPRGKSQEQRRPWLTDRISRRQWFRNKANRLPQSRHMAPDGTVSAQHTYFMVADELVPITTRIYPGQVLRGEVGPSDRLVALGIPVPSPAPCAHTLASPSLIPDEPKVERYTNTAETCTRPRGGDRRSAAHVPGQFGG
jgi:hypothetical protein